MAGDRDNRDEEIEEPSLSSLVSDLLEEVRIVLPGTQTLFGFQLIVVFNQAFQDRLTSEERYFHLGATMLTVLAIALLLTPAAYHRQIEPERVSRHFLRLATRLISLSMIPLALAVSTEVYLIAKLATGHRETSLILAAAALVVIGSLWYVLPRRARPGDGA